MEKVHSTLKEDDYFICADAEQQLLEFHNSKIVAKAEVSATDVWTFNFDILWQTQFPTICSFLVRL